MTRRLDQLGCALFMCIAACQRDAAPPAAAPPAAASTTGSAERAAIMDPMPSGADTSRERPATLDVAGASAAAGSGTASASRAGAGAAARSGSAGASAATEPDLQPTGNPSAADSCALPNTYARASLLTLELTWPETLAFVGGTGTLVMWTKLAYTRSSAGALELDARPCGWVTPPTTTTELASGLQMAVQVPFSAFDSPSMPVDKLTVTQAEDRSLTFAYGTVLGAMLPDPAGTWPNAESLVPFDHDGDGSPGLTFFPLEGPEYVAPPSSISQLEVLDRLYVAVRARMQVSIAPACSGSAVGTVEPLAFNLDVVGCHVKNGDECDASEKRFIASSNPRYMLGASGTWTEVEVPQDASCADVRAALPPP